MKIKTIVILFGFSFLLQGCGMMGGHLFHSGNHVTHHKKKSNHTMIRELQQDRYRIEMIVPAMTIGNQYRIMVTIWDEYMGQYISGATVFVYAQYVPDELFVPANTDLEYDYKYQADEHEEAAYDVMLIPDEVGKLAIKAEVRLREQNNEPFEIELIQEVFPAETSQNQYNYVKPWVILGGIGMGIMMVFMLGWDMH